MAIYPAGSQNRPAANMRGWIYLAFAVLAAAVVLFFIYTRRAPEKGVAQTEIAPAPQPSAAPAGPNIPGPAAAPEPNQPAALISDAVNFMSSHPADVIPARDRLNSLLLMPLSRSQAAFVKEQLSRLSEKWLFSASIFPDDKLCSSYKVQTGDQLRVIGQQFKVPYEIIMQINNIPRPQALQAGQTIKIPNGPFHAKVYRSTFTLDLYLQDTFVRSFPVGLGLPGRETPIGLWQVKPDGKLISPTWTDPDTGKTYKATDPDYPLGSRWIALEGIEGSAVGRQGIAIHGTKDPNQIGGVGSRGCIRLHNGDVILMYNLLAPRFSTVQVFD